MLKIKRFFRNKAFDLLLFAVAVGLFNWPLLTIADKDSVQSHFYYLYVCWAVVVGLLMVWAVSGRRSDEDDRNKG